MAAAIGLGLQAYSSFSAGSKSKKQARKTAKLERLLTSEEIRRMEKEQAQVLGTARAQIAASGFTGYGASSEAYLEELQKEQGAQLAFTKQAGASRAKVIEREGSSLARGYNINALSSIIQGFGKAGASFNWGLDETTNNTTG